jgi:hypothetical protein
MLVAFYFGVPKEKREYKHVSQNKHHNKNKNIAVCKRRCPLLGMGV